MCKDCNKYTVSCSVLEGFECCKCCGILECKYDICPAEEKIHTKNDRTVYEFSISSDISYFENSINNARDAIVLNKYTRYYHNNAISAREKLIELREDIRGDHKISDKQKVEFLARIKALLKSFNNLYYWVYYRLKKDRRFLKKTMFMYVMKHLDNYSPETIGANEVLCLEEKKMLLKKKKIENPLIYIKY